MPEWPDQASARRQEYGFSQSLLLESGNRGWRGGGPGGLLAGEKAACLGAQADGLAKFQPVEGAARHLGLEPAIAGALQGDAQQRAGRGDIGDVERACRVGL